MFFFLQITLSPTFHLSACFIWGLYLKWRGFPSHLPSLLRFRKSTPFHSLVYMIPQFVEHKITKYTAISLHNIPNFQTKNSLYSLFLYFQPQKQHVICTQGICFYMFKFTLAQGHRKILWFHILLSWTYIYSFVPITFKFRD